MLSHFAHADAQHSVLHSLKMKTTEGNSRLDHITQLAGYLDVAAGIFEFHAVLKQLLASPGRVCPGHIALSKGDNHGTASRSRVLQCLERLWLDAIVCCHYQDRHVCHCRAPEQCSHMSHDMLPCCPIRPCSFPWQEGLTLGAQMQLGVSHSTQSSWPFFLSLAMTAEICL